MLVRLFLLPILDSKARLCDGDEWWNWLAGWYILMALLCVVSFRVRFAFHVPTLFRCALLYPPHSFPPCSLSLSLLFPALPPATLDLNHHHYRL